MGALMTILVLAVGSISIVGTSQFVMGLDPSSIDGFVVGCVYAACKNATISGGTSSQPTPNTAKLIVIKECNSAQCTPSNFQITVTGNSPSPSSFQGDPAGTTVILGPGQYTVSENQGPVLPAFSGNCKQIDTTFSASGNINAGETQKCTITNGTP